MNSIHSVVFGKKMKRRGGGASPAASSSNVVEADVDDRALSSTAKVRAANKVRAEATGRSSTAAALPLPIGFYVLVAAVFLLMLYLTVYFR